MNQSDSDLPNGMGNHLIHTEVSATMLDIASHDPIESDTFQTGRTIFVTIFLFSDTSCFEQLGLTVWTVNLGNLVPKDDYQQDTDKAFILAFDHNAHGIDTIQKTIECFKSLGIEDYKIALPPYYGTSWYDLNLSGQLAHDKIQDTLNKAYFQGKLLLAESAHDYFRLYQEQYPDTQTLIFSFKNCLYKAYPKKAQKGSDVDDTAELKQLTDCNIWLSYSVIDESQNNKKYHRIELYSDRASANNKIPDSSIELTDTQLMRLSTFKTELQKHKQFFYGNQKDFIELLRYLFASNPLEVRALSAIGYDKKSNGYFFPEFAYDTNGKKQLPNRNQYIDVVDISGNKQPIQPFNGCNNTIVNTVSIDVIDIPDNESSPQIFYSIEAIARTPSPIEQFLLDFITSLNIVYGARALLAFGFYISSLFSHIIFNHYGFFPILSLYGNPNPYYDDKRFLIRLFNRCFFIDSEGQKMKAPFTATSELKKICQKSNLVSALLDDRKYKSQFDYDVMLPFYNRKALSSNATLAFVSSTEHFSTDVIRELIISLQFPNIPDFQYKLEWQQLNNYTSEQLASAGNYLLTNRQIFEKRLINTITKYETDLTNSGISIPRMAQNYAIALGGIVCLLNELKMQQRNQFFTNQLIENLANYTTFRAQHKQNTTSNRAYLAQYFLNLIEHSNLINKGTAEGVDFHGKSDLQIDLPVVLKQLKMHDFDFNEKILSSALKEHYRFLDYDTSFQFGTTRKVYSFEKSKIISPLSES